LKTDCKNKVRWHNAFNIKKTVLQRDYLRSEKPKQLSVKIATSQNAEHSHRTPPDREGSTHIFDVALNASEMHSSHNCKRSYEAAASHCMSVQLSHSVATSSASGAFLCSVSSGGTNESRSWPSDSPQRDFDPCGDPSVLSHPIGKPNNGESTSYVSNVAYPFTQDLNKNDDLTENWFAQFTSIP
jgi:hypothetical protein